MTLVDPNMHDPSIPRCEKHNFRGYNCLLCRAEEIGHYTRIKQCGIDLSNKLEALLIACEATEVTNLFPYIFDDAKNALAAFKLLAQ